MTMPPTPDGSHDVRLHVDAGRLWAGGVATALVAALVAVVGVLVARGLLGVEQYEPTLAPALAAGATSTYAWVCAGAALLATGLMHLLIILTPRPFAFFTWIMSLLVALLSLLPLVTDAADDVRLTSALINLAVGISIGSLVAGVARSALRVTTRRDRPDMPFDP